ncbi:MAG: hypothetical protein ACOY3P_24835 [Planctomycetota bacterium]
MVPFEYLSKGLIGLANAHKAGTMAGHLGAAVAAAYFFGEDQSDLPDEVFAGVEGEVKRILAGEESIWFDPKRVGITPAELFRPLPEEEPTPDAIASIADSLEKNAGELRQSGHNVIFASIAIRALREHPERAAPSVITGVRKLIEGFDNAHAGRGYFGKQKGWLNGNQVELADDSDFPAYRNVQEMVKVTIGELIATAGIRKQGFGGLWHLVNHAAAITELDRFGYKQLVQNALPAHHQHVRLWRSLPDVAAELGPVEKAPHDPREPAYWMGNLKRDEARLTHRIKTLYGYYTIRRFVDDDMTKNRADEAFLFLMG